MSNKHHNVKLAPPTFEPWHPGDDPGRDIIVLMSGGVDSSTTVLLLKRAGWNVLGITMKMPVAERCDVQRSCCGLEAAYVARDLGIAHYYLDVRDAFRELVIEPFRQSYMDGRTPSPCVDCNTVFKFGLVWDVLESEFGVSSLATGHYARVIHEEDRVYLTRAVDKTRDQSYFLYGVPRKRLASLVLPLGDYTKDKVREIAGSAGMPVARRSDSMELCFAGEGDYRNALGEGSLAPGPVLDMSGNVLGEHDGIANFTLGQRKGLKIALGKPAYVTRINPENNSITVGTFDEAFEAIISAHEVNVLIPEKLRPGTRLLGKIRSQGDPTVCTVLESTVATMKVEFDSPQFAPTPGQRLVLYDDDEHVVCGGVIC